MPDDGRIISDPRPPAELSVLVGAIGVEATIRLIEARGGTRLYVPKALSPHAGLGLEIGLDTDACARLASIFGGQTFTPPLARDWRCRVYHARGLSYAKIARKIGVAERTVWRWLNGAGLTTSQLELPLG